MQHASEEREIFGYGLKSFVQEELDICFMSELR